MYPDEEFDMKHIHFPVIPDVPMEVHFVPSMLRDPFTNRRLVRFYEQEAMTQMRHSVKIEGVEESLGGLNCPTTSFNLVFQLTHLFNHYLTEGVGLRQVMDYYYVLKQVSGENGAVSDNNLHQTSSILHQLRLDKFAAALMWVMKEVLGMEEELMIVPVDERRGRVLLDEILAGGNFGQYESRYWYRGMSRWKFYIARMRRMSHFLRYYPREVLWDIPARIRQRVWMMWKGGVPAARLEEV